jgi:diguanylate cyclase
MRDASDWREKYLTAIDRLEAQTNAWKQIDDVLRRLIKRLCIAARGIDATFDSELARLSGALRESTSPEELEVLLGRLTTAVTALDAARLDAAKSSRAAPAPTAAPAPAPASAETAAPAPTSAPAPTGTVDAPGRAGEPLAPGSTGLDALAEPLHLILERLGLGEAAQAEMTALRADLATPAAGSAFESALWRIGDLVAAEQQRLEREKSETERVLQQVTSRLGEFASFLADSDGDRGDADRSGRELNEQLLGEVHEIGTTMRMATSLGDLQEVVKTRLEAIDAHLRAFRARESQRAGVYRERAQRMRERVVQLEGETASLEKSLAREHRLAKQDGLTGIANRLAYDQRIAQELKRWKRYRQPLSLVAWDLDRFKVLNDSYGHRAGDRVLRAFAAVLRETVRATDFVARYGGEEFVMLLVGTPVADARAVAEAIREQIGRLGFHFRGTPVSVTASCGITEARADDTPERLFDRADQALYRAKQAGRDRCIVG